VTPSTSHASVKVAGFWIRSQYTSNASITTYMYLADASGKPTGTPVRTGEMLIGTTQAYYATGWPSFTVPAGKPFFVGFRTPATGTMTAPFTTR